MTDATENLKNFLSPRIEAELEKFKQIHGDLTIEEEATVRLLLKSIIISSRIKRQEANFNRLHIIYTN